MRSHFSLIDSGAVNQFSLVPSETKNFKTTAESYRRSWWSQYRAGRQILSGRTRYECFEGEEKTSGRFRNAGTLVDRCCGSQHRILAGFRYDR